MIRCLICNQSYSRRGALQRHERNVHGSGKYTDQSQPLKEMTFRHPFSMMVTGPSGSGKTEWTRKLLLSSLVQPPPERILWCFGQWQPLYEDLQKRIPCIEFIRGIPDYLDNAQFMDPSKRNLIILMTWWPKQSVTRELPTFLRKAVTTEIYLSCIWLKTYFLKVELAGISL